MSQAGFIERVDVRHMPSEDLAALLRVSSILASTLDPPSLMQTAITAACDVMDLETGAIYLLEDMTLALQATAPPTPPDFPNEYRRAPLDDHPNIARSIDVGDPLWVEDTMRGKITKPSRECNGRRDPWGQVRG